MSQTTRTDYRDALYRDFSFRCSSCPSSSRAWPSWWRCSWHGPRGPRAVFVARQPRRAGAWSWCTRPPRRSREGSPDQGRPRRQSRTSRFRIRGTQTTRSTVTTSIKPRDPAPSSSQTRTPTTMLMVTHRGALHLSGRAGLLKFRDAGLFVSRHAPIGNGQAAQRSSQVVSD